MFEVPDSVRQEILMPSRRSGVVAEALETLSRNPLVSNWVHLVGRRDPPTPSTTFLGKLLTDSISPEYRLRASYARMVFAVGASKGLCGDDLHDLLEDTVGRARKGLPKFDRKEGRTFRAWLCRIAQRLTADFHRKWPHWTTVSPDEWNRVESEEAEMHWKGEFEKLQRGLAVAQRSCSPQMWTAFMETWLGDRPIPEVAAELGATPSAVYLWRSRALARVRKAVLGDAQS